MKLRIPWWWAMSSLLSWGLSFVPRMLGSSRLGLIGGSAAVKTKGKQAQASDGDMEQQSAGRCKQASVLDRDPPLIEVGEDVLVRWIVSQLSARDVLALEACCRRLREVGQQEDLWQQLCLKDYAVWYKISGYSYRHLYKELTAALKSCTNAQPLKFRGVATDGGCDNGDQGFWVENLYTPESWSNYCSASGDNINCVAVLLPGFAAADEQEKQQRDYIIERTSLLAALMFGVAGAAAAAQAATNAQAGANAMLVQRDLEKWSTPQLETFLEELFMMFEIGHPLGQLLFQGLRSPRREEEEARMRHMVADVRRRRPGHGRKSLADGIVQDTEKANWMYSTDIPVQQPVLGLVMKIELNRSGHFSCPVSCGAILIGRRHTPRSTMVGSSHSDCRNSEWSSVPSGLLEKARQDSSGFQDLTTLEQVLEASHEGSLPPVLGTHTCLAGVWVEFKPPCDQDNIASNDALQPVIWFKFISKTEARNALRAASMASSGAASPNGDVDYDRMEITLQQRRTGNFTCARLISSEDLMDEFEDPHEAPNIDMNFVGLSGCQVQLPYAVAL